MVQAAFDHRFRTWLAIFLQQMLFQRPRIDANANGTAVIARRCNHFAHPVSGPDIAGIDPQAGGPGLCGFDRAAVVEMNIGHDRHRAFGDDLFQGFGAGLIRCRHTHDIRARLCRSQHLRNRRFDIRGIGVRHCLHRDRGISPDRHIAHHDLTGCTTINISPRTDWVMRHMPALRLIHV